MALPLAKLGDTQFRFWAGAPPQIVKTRLLVDQRPGVNGSEITQLGTFGDPFQMTSGCDYANFDAADAAYGQHVLLIAGVPVTLIWNDLNSNTRSCKVQVLNVERSVLKALKSAVGGLNPPSNAWQECVWTLLPIAN